ncbi:unnamed protein product [Lampetra planeri]
MSTLVFPLSRPHPLVSRVELLSPASTRVVPCYFAMGLHCVSRRVSAGTSPCDNARPTRRSLPLRPLR